MKGKIEGVLDLAPKIEELSKTVETHQKMQADANRIIFAEINAARNSVTPAVEAQLKQNMLDIAGLAVQYRQLYAFAHTLFYGSSSAPTYEAASRSPKAITAF